MNLHENLAFLDNEEKTASDFYRERASDSLATYGAMKMCFD